jgi:hypothetical protein
MAARTRRIISAVAFVVTFGTVPASAAGLADYDVQKAESWADALAICDVTKFLLSEPNLASEVIIAPVPGGAQVALRRPYFLPPANFYSEVMKETYERARASGQVTEEAYGAARLRYAKLMLSAYHGSMADKSFLADQMKLCYALASDASGRAKANKPGASR